MKARILGMACFAILLAGAAGAQTKISGTVTCAKPDVVGTQEVGDHPGHTLSLTKGTCSWSKPMEIEGAKTKDDTDAGFTEATATRMTGSGFVVGTLDSGDKMFVSVHDSTPIKDGKPGETAGTWSFSGGTGKIKGIKGKGTYKGTGSADGSITFDVEGEYSMPAPAAPKAAKPKSK